MDLYEFIKIKAGRYDRSRLLVGDFGPITYLGFDQAINRLAAAFMKLGLGPGHPRSPGHLAR